MSNSNPVISVVVPSYNHAQYIESALQSVANQTFESIELIIIDDCSKDETVTRAAQWLASRSQRFINTRLIRNQQNRGADETINRGIDAASGEFVAILNSDDLFMPTRLDELSIALKSTGRDVAFSKVIPINDYGNFIPADALPDVLTGIFDEADRYLANCPSIGFGFVEKNIAISTGNLLIRRSLFERIGKFRKLRYIHDWDFLLRSLLINEPVYVPSELYGYRIHSSNSFSQLGDVAHLETLVTMNSFRTLAESAHIQNPLAPLRRNWPQLPDLRF